MRLLLVLMLAGCPAAFLIPPNDPPAGQNAQSTYKADMCAGCIRNRNECEDGLSRPMTASCGTDYRNCLVGNGVTDADCR